MKFVSWNVNGIRSILKKGFLEFLSDVDADVIALQEVRAYPDQVHLPLEDTYKSYWNPAQKKGYSGTLILSKQPALSCQLGIGLSEHDTEGRVITLEYDHYYFVNVYTPNSKRGLFRLPYRHEEWDVLFLKFLKNLETHKPVIFCGDLNVAHKEIDLANPKSNRNNAGFTDEERLGFDNIINAGFIDTFREFNKEGGNYTWWSNFSNAREKNIGWRIDYFCISASLRPYLQTSTILNNIFGSDHCPIVMTLDN